MKTIILWRLITDYLAGCVSELAANSDSVIVVEEFAKNLSHQKCWFSGHKNVKVFNLQTTTLTTEALIDEIINFRPDIVLSSLSYGDTFFEINKRLKQKGALVIGASDVYYKMKDPKLHKLLRGKLGVWKCYDCIWVPGYRGREHARILGFKDDKIFEGLYCCNTTVFQTVGRERDYQSRIWPKRFLFVGQFIPRKGLELLLEAYRQYRELVGEPWTLSCLGAGPLAGLFSDQPGVVNLGFKSPQECALEMRSSGALILPSLRDHWPLVIHEAVCAGLPVIATHDCGSTVELVQDGCNGFVVPSGQVTPLVKAIKRLSEGEPFQMGKISYLLSHRYNPKIWVERLLRDIPRALGKEHCNAEFES